MRFNVAGLLKSSPGSKQIVQVGETLEVRGDEAKIIGPIAGELVLIRELSGVLVSGSLQAMMRVPCGRCLEPVEVEVDLEIEEHYRPTVAMSGGPMVDSIPEEDEDPATLLDAQHTLDLSEVLRQAVLVAIPLNERCRDDCAGLCPICGVNRNSVECDCEPEPDPRWSELRALLEDG